MDQPSLFGVHLPLLHDTEMAWRLWEKGFQVYYSPGACGYHYHPRSLDDFLKRAEDEARAMNAWIQAEPYAARLLSQEHFRKRFYSISPTPPFHCRLKSFVRRLLVNRGTEGLLIRLCKRISEISFPAAYRISSQMFITRFTEAYKRLQQGFPVRQTLP
jgi:GT2 family glycosyltransferase